MIETTGVKQSFQTLLQELADAVGPSGYETPAREVMERWLNPWVDEVRQDRLGSLVARKGTTGPRIMIASHLDEVGFMVTRIEEGGFLRFQPLGGWWSQVLPAQRVEVVTERGRFLGVIGSKPPHMMSLEERKKGVTLDELFIDMGVESKEEAEALGIRQGDFVVPYSPFTKLNHPHRYVAKAFDNRLGCAVVTEVLRRFGQGIPHPNQIFAVSTVLEEVGRRGALTSTHIAKPDLAFAIDIGLATDSPGIKTAHTSSHLGEGPVVVLYDAGHIAHQGMLEMIREIAEEQNIPYQYEVIQRGATDASYIHTYNTGVPTLSLGVPGRYIHSHASIIDDRDAENLIRLLVEMIGRLDQETVEFLQKS